jgi:hypothetical protein
MKGSEDERTSKENASSSVGRLIVVVVNLKVVILSEEGESKSFG